MKKHSRVQKKYFFRNLIVYLLYFTFPIVILGTSLIIYYRHQLQEELSSYADQSRINILYNVNSVLTVFSEETALFSSKPSLSLAVSKLLNRESMDYKSNVYKNTIFSIISTGASLNEYVDSIYIYFDNPYGNFFSNVKEFTNINSPDSMDKDWLSICQNTHLETQQWITRRKVRYFSFETAKETVSIFRRLESFRGIMVINLDYAKLSNMLSSNQIYEDSFTLITDSQNNILFGSTGIENLDYYNDTFHNVKLKHSDSKPAFYSMKVQGVDYFYFTSPIPDYDLQILSLIPNSAVFKTMNSTLLTFSIMFIFSILLSISLSWVVTNKKFRQLQNLLDLFSIAERGDNYKEMLRLNTKNEYDVIFNNIVQTFISSNILQLNLAQAQVKQKDAQLAALQLQLSPHFIFNTLQTIDMEILRLKPIENNASKLTHNLSDILKYSLENTLKRVEIRDEIAICKAYAEIQKFRYENPFILYWDYDDSVLKEKVIHLLLQPLLENSLHHGIKELPRRGLVKIKIFKSRDDIRVYIIDNGIGIDSRQLAEIRSSLHNRNIDQTAHIGIYNTNLRLILTYGEEAAIKISSKKGAGTIVSFRFHE
ncbi:cache domain-containing sensor histidine kinase [Anaerotaenia torta]|uniref:cache domain-containing sensor histidine kinase n=1 Tax=Anaerotaenia torta TaxID=433293 RepID=UPI003D1FD1D0